MVVFDIETSNTIRCVPYADCTYRRSKLSGKYNRDITKREHEKFKNVCIVCKGLDNINELIDYVSQFEVEAKTTNNKTVKFNSNISNN